MLPDKVVAMVTPDYFFMLHRLILKVTKFQLPPPKRLSTVVNSIFARWHHDPPSCQIGLSLLIHLVYYLKVILEHNQQDAQLGIESVGDIAKDSNNNRIK